MARRLDERDIAILKKLAPELEELVCGGSGHEFQSILPPVSNHVASDGEDFRRRISLLENEELEYIADRIIDGSESLGCVPPEDVESLTELLEKRVSEEKAEGVRRAYRLGEGCSPADL